jgi:hypothetical protein
MSATTSWRSSVRPTGRSLAQVIRLEGQQVSLQVFAGSQGVSNNDRVRFLHKPMQVPFSEACWAACSTARCARATAAAGDRRPARHRFAGGQPRAAAHARPDGRHRHPDDRRVQLAGRIAEAADLLGGGRTVQRIAGADRAAGQRRHHHPGRHGAAARRLPEVPPDLRGRRRAGPRDHVHPHGRRPGGRVLAGARPVPGGRRAVRAARQARAGAADRHDGLLRRAEGNRDHHGADSVEPRLSGRPVHPAGPRYEKAVDFDGPVR